MTSLPSPIVIPQSHRPSATARRTVLRGEAAIETGQRAGLWRMERGVCLIERPTRDGRDVVALALPGDLIGVESLLGEAAAFGATALLDATVYGCDLAGESDLARVLGHAVRQQQRQSLEMAELRSGPVVERLQHLLRLLSRPYVRRETLLDRKELPTLRDIAQIVNSAPETVCRELNRLVPARPRAPRNASPAPWMTAPAGFGGTLVAA